jgi:Mn-dependent DtxR family transcriptional regulator
MANESVRPRIMDFLETRSHFVHIGGIARGAQVSPGSVRKVLAELIREGRLETTRDMPGATTTFGYRLRREPGEEVLNDRD